MQKLGSKDEAFAIKAEEIIKHVLSSEAFQQDMSPEPEPEVEDDDNIDTIMTEEEMTQMIKAEPHDKSFLLKELNRLNSKIVNKEFVSRYNFRHQSLANSNANLDEENLTDSNSNETTIPKEINLDEPALPQEPVLAEPAISEPAFEEPASTDPALPELSSTELSSTETMITDLAIPEPTLEEHASSPDQTPAEQGENDVEMSEAQRETTVDVKPVFKNPTIDYESIYCKLCGISFNDNLGFRRHLNYVHPDQDVLPQVASQSRSVRFVDNETGSSSSSSSSSPAPSAATPAPPSPPIKPQNCNKKFKRQYRANLKVTHLKYLPQPATYIEGATQVQCRFCKQEALTQSTYRTHLIQRHSNELNPLAKQITAFNTERSKDTAQTPMPAVDASPAPPPASEATTEADPDITLLDIPYDPIIDISENQRRTYGFFQTYMLDIS